jgi:hypothetical protein
MWLDYGLSLLDGVQSVRWVDLIAMSELQAKMFHVEHWIQPLRLFYSSNIA